MSLIPLADKEAHDRFKFIADWYVDRFEESPSVAMMGLGIGEGSYEHLELLEECFKDKKMIDENVDERTLY